MPTGYTAGIIDGTIKTFREFATLCMRNFGATMHMGDEPFSEPYKKRIPSDYHYKEIKSAIKQIERAQSTTDDELVSEEESKLKINIKNYKGYIVKVKKTNENLTEMLTQAMNWEPPTADHKGLKEFMMEQLRSTIKQDGQSGYWDDSLESAKIQFKNVNPSKIRQDMFLDALKNLEYHTEHYKKDIEGCNESNEWVNALLTSLKE